VTDKLAGALIRVRGQAYEAQLGDGALPKGVATAHYNPDKDNGCFVAEWRRNMLAGIALDDQHWTARDADGRLRGHIQLTRKPSSVYIASVVVAPPWGTGIGRSLAHASLAFGGFDPRSGVDMYAYVGSSVNEWYARLGFEPRPEYQRITLGDRTLLAQWYAAPSALALGGIVSNLEQEAPELRNATVHRTAETNA
jgi:hypothetical protein